MDRKCIVLLTDVRLDRNLEFVNDTVNLNDERRKKYACYICTAKFLTSRELNKHRAMHTESEHDDSDENDDTDEDDIFEEELISKPSKRTLRKKSLAEKVDLNPESVPADTNKERIPDEVHVNVEETPFKCDTCQVFFATPDEAKLHKPSSRCRFSCKMCNRKLNTLYAFVVHVMQHRVNVVKNQIPAQSAYICTLCNKSFEDCFQLKRHEVITHKLKPNSAASSNSGSPLPPKEISTDSSNENETPKPKTPQPVSQYITPPPKAVSELINVNEVTCDLCYDIFNSQEELDRHVELHKQLEVSKGTQDEADLIVIEDDDDEVVEVIEEKKCASEIITTIKKSAPPKMPIPPLRAYKYATLKPLYPKPDLPRQYPSAFAQSNSTVSNRVLSDTIKDMLTPNSEKQSKTILLPSPMEKAPTASGKKSQQKVSALESLSGKLNNDLELRKTGPLSYSLCYKGVSSPSSTTQTSTTTAINTASNSFAPPSLLYTTASTSKSLEVAAPSSNIVSAGINDNSNIQLIIQNAPNLGSTITNTSSATTTVTTTSDSFPGPSLLYTTASASAAQGNLNSSSNIVSGGLNDNSNIKFIIQNVPNLNPTITNTSSTSVTTAVNTVSDSLSLTSLLYTTASASTENSNPSSNIISDGVNDNSNIKFIIQNVPTLDPTVAQTSSSCLTSTISTVSDSSSFPSVLYTTPSVSTANPSSNIASAGVNDNSNIKLYIQNIPNLNPTTSLSNLVINSSSTPSSTSSFQNTSAATTAISNSGIANNVLWSTPINLNDSNKIAYIIIPHGQASPATNLPANKSLDVSNVPALIPTVTSVQTSESNITTTPVIQATSNISKEPVSTLFSSEVQISPEVQMPLITNVTSLNTEQHSEDTTLPVISNVTSVASVESASNSKAEVSLPEPASSVSNSDMLTSKPGPSHENDDVTIIIDSDSDTEAEEDETDIKKNAAETCSIKSDSEEENLVIDENTSDKNITNEDPEKQNKGLIFVRDMTELLEPTTEHVKEKDSKQESTATGMKKEKKGYKFFWRCSECTMVFRRLKAIRNHDEKKYRCKKCVSKFCKLSGLKDHYLSEHKMYFCVHCLIMYESQSELSQHKMKIHMCPKCCRAAANLVAHVCKVKKRYTTKGKNEISTVE